jgi:hypothetical protein
MSNSRRPPLCGTRNPSSSSAVGLMQNTLDGEERRHAPGQADDIATGR